MAYSWSVNARGESPVRAVRAGYPGARWNGRESSPVLVPKDHLEPGSADKGMGQGCGWLRGSWGGLK